MTHIECGQLSPDEYVAAKAAEELTLLPHANVYHDNEQYYGNKRSAVARLALEEIEQRLRIHGRRIRVLEIGGGQGKAILRLFRALPVGSPVDYAMTTLNDLPEHIELREFGVELVIPAVAEYLPSNWTDHFDVVMTQCVLGWTDMSRSIQEIRRVLVPGGTWVGFESSEATLITSHIRVSEALEHWLDLNGMHNQFGFDEMYVYKHEEEHYPIRWTK